MASRYGLRFVVMGLAGVLCSMTIATTTQAYFDSGGGTASASTWYDNVIVLTDYDPMPASAFLLPVAKEQRITSEHRAFQPKAIKERASRSAVRPTALSGWRSGRTRTLATG